MKMTDITGVVITKNEKERIKDRINELSFCKEIIIVDDNSSDQTRKIAEKLGAKVFQFQSESFSEKRNYALNKTKTKWALFLDADEVLSTDLKKEILDAIKNDLFSGYYIRRRDIFFGKELKWGEQGQTKLLRLGRKGMGKWTRGVHERWMINGKIGLLQNKLLHKQSGSMRSYINKINFYSSMHAIEKFKENKRSSLCKIILFPILKFLHNFVYRSGYRDGVHGFMAAILMSLHSYLSWSKLWILQKK